MNYSCLEPAGDMEINGWGQKGAPRQLSFCKEESQRNDWKSDLSQIPAGGQAPKATASLGVEAGRDSPSERRPAGALGLRTGPKSAGRFN